MVSNKNAEAFLKIGEVRTKMGMFDPKKRKIITAVIAVILVLAMVVPSVTKIEFEILPKVLQIFNPPIVASPLVEKACVCKVSPPAHKNSLSISGVPVIRIFFASDIGSLKVL